MICAWEGRRKPESHALVCFRTLVVRVLRHSVLPLTPRMRLLASPVQADHALGRIRCALAEMCAMVCGMLCVSDVVWNTGVE